MSLDREYETSKGGPTRRFTVSNTSTRIRLCDVSDANFKPASFAIEVFTANVRFRQGGPGVTVSATSTDADYGKRLKANTMQWRIDVDKPEEAFVAFIRDTSTDAAVEITRISDVATDDVPTAVS